ncbi:MAG: hypothetical protein KGH80_08475, partial [Xanthomonadaceae bacterium]|nr:hypothetical protein [Xanthomonadaceae bacterium]
VVYECQWTSVDNKVPTNGLYAGVYCNPSSSATIRHPFTVNHWVGGSIPSRGANNDKGCSGFPLRPFVYQLGVCLQMARLLYMCQRSGLTSFSLAR